MLEREHGEEIRELGARRPGFGIVAGTGTGKTLGIRPIAETILGEPLRVGVVNREREATPETPTWNVVIVTTGIARRWFQDDLITRATPSSWTRSTRHPPSSSSASRSASAPAAGSSGSPPPWIRPSIARYLDSAEVLETDGLRPRAPRPGDGGREAGRGVPRRALPAARDPGEARASRSSCRPARRWSSWPRTLGERWSRAHAAFYHGGEPIRVIRPFLEGEAQKPFLLAMTAAGQSALNMRGLDTVVIYDARYGNVVRARAQRAAPAATSAPTRSSRWRAGCTAGWPRARSYILTDRDLDFESLGRGRRSSSWRATRSGWRITCAALGVDARDLDLPVPLDRRPTAARWTSDRAAGSIEDGRLTRYGREVEALPVERPWAELLVHADADLVPLVAVARPHRVAAPDDARGTRAARAGRARQRPPDGATTSSPRRSTSTVPRRGVRAAAPRLRGGAGAVGREARRAGQGDRGRRPRRARRSTARSSCRCPRRLPLADRKPAHALLELLARVMPFDLVIDEHTADGTRPGSRTSVAGAGVPWPGRSATSPTGGRGTRRHRGHHHSLRPGAAVCAEGPPSCWPAPGSTATWRCRAG